MDVYYDGRGGGSPGPISLIRDSARNIDYIINRQLNNCTVMPRDDAILTPVDWLSLAQQFPYAYEGVTNIRGVDVDAWIGMQPLRSLRLTTGVLELRNGTWELFFTRPGWRITGDRPVITEPVLWRVIISVNSSFTNATDSTTTNGSYSALYDIFDFSSEEPDFDVFDVSTCFSPSEYRVLSLAVPGHEQGLNIHQFRRNLLSAIVEYSSIQPLQVGNIQVSWDSCT